MGFYDRMKAERAAKAANSADGVKPKYKILQVDMLKSVDRERAAAVASFVNSAEDAYKLAGHEGFSYFDLDLRGRCGVVRYRGVDVALLFRREIIEREPGPAEPVPQRQLSSPKEAWIRVDLLGSDEFEKEKGNSDNLRRTMAQKDRLQLLWQQSEAEKKSLEEKLEKLKREVTTNTQLKERTALQEKQIEQTDKDVLALRRDIRQEQEARKSDKVHMIQEMLPMFNTTWLAGLHRSNDQLYTIIRKQMEEALGKLGVVLIEPLVGELFNPTKHHAIHSYEFAEGAPEVGTIRQVNKVGWSMNGVVVEAAEVAVGVEKKGGADESVLTA